MGRSTQPGRTTVIDPARDFAGLFEAVQQSGRLGDSKTFVDAVPREAPAAIMDRYRRESLREGFDLLRFVETHFDLPKPAAAGLAADPSLPVREHIERLWVALTREDKPDETPGSHIALPRPYVVPGGRFREIYYWDSYFTMLGLAASGRQQQVADMVENFAYLIDSVGFVPNGNRSYFCSRSQPPFFALMVELLAGLGDEQAVLARYRPQLETEYAFWMRDPVGGQASRALRYGDVRLNRYWDDEPTPRPESWLEDVETAETSGGNPDTLYREIRAACESGWDFSSRWLSDPGEFSSIRTTRLLPVDLNCLLAELERVLGRARAAVGDERGAAEAAALNEARAELIRGRFFRDEAGFFTDLYVDDLAPSPRLTLAGAQPGFYGVASEAQAGSVARVLAREFLAAGGWRTSTVVSGQQWDAPSGWAPLQWICYAGLSRYGHDEEAREGARRWVDNNLALYADSGRLMERYDVVDVGRRVAGGEYVVQDGFGWTNGVLLKLMDELGID